MNTKQILSQNNQHLFIYASPSCRNNHHILRFYIHTVKCLSIGTLITIHFPFAPKVKSIIFRDPQIWTHYSLITMCSYIGTPKNINFPFGTNGKLMVLGVPILKYFRVIPIYEHYQSQHKKHKYLNLQTE